MNSLLLEQKNWLSFSPGVENKIKSQLLIPNIKKHERETSKEIHFYNIIKNDFYSGANEILIFNISCLFSELDEKIQEIKG